MSRAASRGLARSAAVISVTSRKRSVASSQVRRLWSSPRIGLGSCDSARSSCLLNSWGVLHSGLGLGFICTGAKGGLCAADSRSTLLDLMLRHDVLCLRHSQRLQDGKTSSEWQSARWNSCRKCPNMAWHAAGSCEGWSCTILTPPWPGSGSVDMQSCERGRDDTQLPGKAWPARGGALVGEAVGEGGEGLVAGQVLHDDPLAHEIKFRG